MVEARLEHLRDPAGTRLQEQYLETLRAMLDEDVGEDMLRSDAEEFEPPSGAWIVLYLDDRPVACGGLRDLGEGVAEVKRMYVDPGVRRQGLARRLLAELEMVAEAAGYNRVRLDTTARFPGTRRLYSSSGYVQIPRFNDNEKADLFFEKHLPST